MRRLLLLMMSLTLTACNSAGTSTKDIAKENYAREVYAQSLKAYQLCAAENAGAQEKCRGLLLVMENDKKRYEKLFGAM